MNTFKKNWLKFTIGIISCTFIRFLPFRPPNVEPVLAVLMPFSRAYGYIFGFIFAFLNIFLYDLLTFKVGIWTLMVGIAYGLLGIFAFFFFNKYKDNKWNYVVFAVLGTIFFDLMTGLSIGPLFFRQSLTEALIGQIPFTAWHLLGNVAFAIVLSPSLYKFIIKNEKFENLSIINVFNLKKI